MERRSFFKNLLLAPTAFTGIAQAEGFSGLPIPCDLSLTALELALLEGEKLGYGKAVKLVIGPENRFTARELLAPYLLSVDKDDNVHARWNQIVAELGVFETRAMKMGAWFVQFEKGKVGSDMGGF